MANKPDKDPKGENTNAGGHLGGTTFGQEPDATNRSDKAGGNSRNDLADTKR